MLLTLHCAILYVHILPCSHSCAQISCSFCPSRISRTDRMSLAADRLRNTAAPKDIAKALRAEIPEGLAGVTLDEDLGHLCDQFKDAMLAILRLSRKPTKLVLKEAASLAWANCDSQISNHFGERLYAAFLHCRAKKKNSITGERLSEGVRAIVRAMTLSDTYLAPPASWSPITSKRDSKPSFATKLKAQAYNRMKASPVRTSKPSQLGCNPASSSSLSRAEVLALYGVKEDGGDNDDDDDVIVVPSQDDPPSSKKSSRSVKLQHIDRSINKLVRVFDDGTKEEASMTPSKSGFCIARFPGSTEYIETDVPNIIFSLPVMKRPAAKPSKKRPASVLDADEADSPKIAPASSAPSDGQPLVRVYTNPYRYPTGSWGIRRNFANGDKKQLFQFKNAGWNDARNKEVAETAVGKLRAGECEETVIGWVRLQKQS